jgi:hypothetical protein
MRTASAMYATHWQFVSRGDAPLCTRYLINCRGLTRSELHLRYEVYDINVKPTGTVSALIFFTEGNYSAAPDIPPYLTIWAPSFGMDNIWAQDPFGRKSGCHQNHPFQALGTAEPDGHTERSRGFLQGRVRLEGCSGFFGNLPASTGCGRGMNLAICRKCPSGGPRDRHPFSVPLVVFHFVFPYHPTGP